MSSSRGADPNKSWDQERVRELDQFVGNCIRQIRLNKDLSVQDMVERVNLALQREKSKDLSTSDFEIYEAGTLRISAYKLAEIARILDVPISSFFPEGRL